MARMDEQARDDMVERITRVGMLLEDLSAWAHGAAELDEAGLRVLVSEVRSKLPRIKAALREPLCR